MSSKTGNILVALISGAAIGAVAGILFAPDKGSKTRDKIKEGFDDAKNDFQHKFENVSQELKSKFSSTKNDLEGNYENMISNASHKTEEVIVFLENKLADLKVKNAKLQSTSKN